MWTLFTETAIILRSTDIIGRHQIIPLFAAVIAARYGALRPNTLILPRTLQEAGKTELIHTTDTKGKGKMPKFKFRNFYNAPNPPQELVVEAQNEDNAWVKFDKEIIEPIVEAFICEEVWEE